MARREPIDIIVVSSNPDDFISWSSDRKRDRYEAVMKWHDYVEKLSPNKITHVWGSYQILSKTRLTPYLDMRVLVYRVESLQEFDELIDNDPLRDISQYATFPLDSLEHDLMTDIEKMDRQKANLLEGRSDLERAFPAKNRSLYIKTPDYVGKFKVESPGNAAVPYTKRKRASDTDLQLMIMGMNPREMMSWDDSTLLVHYEKVVWWFHYVAMMRDKGLITHAWAAHDFCDIGRVEGVRANAIVVYKAKDLDGLDEAYKQDPLRSRGRFWSILLKPIRLQYEADRSRLEKF